MRMLIPRISASRWSGYTVETNHLGASNCIFEHGVGALDLCCLLTDSVVNCEVTSTSREATRTDAPGLWIHLSTSTSSSAAICTSKRRGAAQIRSHRTSCNSGTRDTSIICRFLDSACRWSCWQTGPSRSSARQGASLRARRRIWVCTYHGASASMKLEGKRQFVNTCNVRFLFLVFSSCENVNAILQKITVLILNRLAMFNSVRDCAYVRVFVCKITSVTIFVTQTIQE